MVSTSAKSYQTLSLDTGRNGAGRRALQAKLAECANSAGSAKTALAEMGRRSFQNYRQSSFDPAVVGQILTGFLARRSLPMPRVRHAPGDEQHDREPRGHGASSARRDHGAVHLLCNLPDLPQNERRNFALDTKLIYRRRHRPIRESRDFS